VARLTSSQQYLPGLRTDYGNLRYISPLSGTSAINDMGLS